MTNEEKAYYTAQQTANVKAAVATITRSASDAARRHVNQLIQDGIRQQKLETAEEIVQDLENKAQDSEKQAKDAKDAAERHISRLDKTFKIQRITSRTARKMCNL